MAKNEYFFGKGRRKEAIATAQLRKGSGQVSINGRPAEAYFGHEVNRLRTLQPLRLLGRESEFDITFQVTGGGLSGQADACRLALARAITVMNAELRTTLKKAGLMTRDSRVKERKKYGLKRARKAPQFTKR